jgi:hypothetical protein
MKPSEAMETGLELFDFEESRFVYLERDGEHWCGCAIGAARLAVLGEPTGAELNWETGSEMIDKMRPRLDVRYSVPIPPGLEEEAKSEDMLAAGDGMADPLLLADFLHSTKGWSIRDIVRYLRTQGQ